MSDSPVGDHIDHWLRDHGHGSHSDLFKFRRVDGCDDPLCCGRGVVGVAEAADRGYTWSQGGRA